MSLRLRQVVLIAVMLLAPCVASAQRASALAAGVRVRVLAPEVLQSRFEGRLIAVADDSLLLTSGNGALRLALPFAHVNTLAVSSGRARKRRAIIGGTIGLVAGGVLGAYLLDREAPGTFAGLVGLLAGGVLGAPTGAVVGAISAPEQWGPALPLSSYFR